MYRLSEELGTGIVQRAKTVDTILTPSSSAVRQKLSAIKVIGIIAASLVYILAFAGMIAEFGFWGFMVFTLALVARFFAGSMIKQKGKKNPLILDFALGLLMFIIVVSQTPTDLSS
jgi:hypothetical protein